MADGVRVTESASLSSPVIAADEIAGAQWQRIKTGFGPDGTATETADADGFRFPVGGAQIGALTETAPANDTASSGQNGRLQRIAQRITSLINLLPASLGSKTAALSLAVTSSTEDIAQTGAVNETAPATDTASSGLNGRLQRIAQRLTSLIALLPAALTAGGGVKVGLVDAILAGTNIVGKVIRAETTVAGTIVIGTSTTVGIAADVRGYIIVGLVVPASFDGTTITFQVSVDNSTYQALYDANNTQVSMTVAASRTYVPWAELQGWSYIKIVTGTAQATTDTNFIWQVQS